VPVYGDILTTPPSKRLSWACDLCGKEAESRVQTLRTQVERHTRLTFCPGCSKHVLVGQGKAHIANEIVEEICKDPLRSYEQIASQYGVDRTAVRSLARKIGLGGVQVRRFAAVRDFFQGDTEQKWWLVGWLVTDGCIYHNVKGTWYLSLGSSDREAAEKTLAVLPVNHLAIREVSNSSSGFGNGSPQHQWAFAVDQETVDVLASLSIHPQKSKSTFVPRVPTQFVAA